MACLRGCDAVILAGGLGRRLRSVCSDRPKVMAPVNGQPFVHYLIEQVRTAGVRRVVLALGYLSRVVNDYLAHRVWEGLEVVSTVEEAPLGTGGALRAALPLIHSQTALVMNGDSFTRMDLCRLLEFHRRRSAKLSMALTDFTKGGRYGVVKTEEDGLVTSYAEKPPGRRSGGHLNAGLYLIDQAAMREIPPGQPVSLERDVFPRYCRRGLYAMKGTFPFIDIGTPESYRMAETFFAESLVG